MMYHILSGLVYLEKHDHKYREIYLMLYVTNSAEYVAPVSQQPRII